MKGGLKDIEDPCVNNQHVMLRNYISIISYKADYTDNAEKYAFYENSTHELRQLRDHIFIIIADWNRK